MEILRRAVRSIIKSDSGFYKTGATILDFLSTIKTDDYKTWRILKALRKGKPNDPSVSVSLRNLKHPIIIRPGTRDTDTIINNIIREEYGQMAPSIPPKWMIDAGAYIGDTSAYFLSRFPDLKVIALEPNPPSFEMAKLNLEPYCERAILLQKGLYSTDGVASFSGESTGASINSTGFQIDCTTISSLMARFSIPRIDILKMDIEGAEEAIFNSSPEKWLSQINLLILEIHGIHIEPLIRRILTDNGFSMKQYRSVWYCRSEKNM